MTYTSGPDELGRRHFFVDWEVTDFRNELHPDGKPVGFRRGQYFFAEPAWHLEAWRKTGRRVIEIEFNPLHGLK